jgi:exonuclease SbcD
MYFNFIGQMQTLDCQLIILAGNHDSVAMLGESKELLSSLSTRVVTHVHDEALIDNVLNANESDINQEKDKSLTASTTQVFAVNNTQGQAIAVICAIPFVRPRDVIKSKAGQSAAQKQKNLQQAITDHYQKLYQYATKLVIKIEQKQGAAVPIIATGHLTALGVSMSDSQSDAVRDIYIGTLEAFPSSAFPPADYIALGHIHRAQKVGKTEHIRYCGSPIALSFDEAKQDKRVLLVDFSTAKLDTVTSLTIPNFQPLMMIKATLENLAEKLDQALGLHQDSHQNVIQDSHQEKLSATAVITEDNNAESLSAHLENIWLDIEIDNSDHLSDLAFRVNEIVDDLPVEVLLVRRSKKSRQQQKNQESTQQNITLNELSVDDVFSSRLTELDWQSEVELARKGRLSTLFKQVTSQVHEQSAVKHNELTEAAVSAELAQVKANEQAELLKKEQELSKHKKSEPST